MAARTQCIYQLLLFPLKIDTTARNKRVDLRTNFHSQNMLYLFLRIRLSEDTLLGISTQDIIQNNLEVF